MSEWITDRLPTNADSDVMGKVWIWEDNAVYWSDWQLVTPGTPWMPIKEPEPYVKPKIKQWKPKIFQLFYFLTERGGIVKQQYIGSLFDQYYIKYGNCFRTKKQAEEAARRVRKLLLNYHKELNNE
jgi:hypothetical protein